MSSYHPESWQPGSPRFSPANHGILDGPAQALNREFTMAARGAKRYPPARQHEEADLIGVLPKEVGVLLIIAGIGGLLLPGPIGSPFLLLGGVTLWPRLFTKLELSFQRRFPDLHRKGTRQVKRFLADLERRYPLPE
jgi:hypothetical protein